MDHELEFLTGSDARIDELDSLTREVAIDGKHALVVLCLNGKWHVRIHIDGNVLQLTWIDFLTIFHDFSEFVANESELILRNERAKEHNQQPEDGESE